jgi:hypothetical protein
MRDKQYPDLQYVIYGEGTRWDGTPVYLVYEGWLTKDRLEPIPADGALTGEKELTCR